MYIEDGEFIDEKLTVKMEFSNWPLRDQNWSEDDESPPTRFGLSLNLYEGGDNMVDSVHEIDYIHHNHISSIIPAIEGAIDEKRKHTIEYVSPDGKNGHVVFSKIHDSSHPIAMLFIARGFTEDNECYDVTRAIVRLTPDECQQVIAATKNIKNEAIIEVG
jgi:hypothetical protein